MLHKYEYGIQYITIYENKKYDNFHLICSTKLEGISTNQIVYFSPNFQAYIHRNLL